MKIRTKLISGFTIILLILLASGLISIYFLTQLEDINQEALYATQNSLLIEEIESAHLSWLNDLANSFLLGEDFTGQLDYTQCLFGDWYYDFIASRDFTHLPQRIQNTLREMEAPHRNIHVSAQEIMELTRQGRREEALDIYENQTVFYIGELRDYLDTYQSYMEEETAAFVLEAQQMGEQSNRITLITIIGALVLGIILALLLNRAITSPIKGMIGHIQEIAERGGDLTQRLNATTRDELADLAHWFNTLLKKLHDIMVQVRNSADTVTSASSEIAEGNQDLSQRTEEQASTLEETSSTIQEIASSLQNTSQHSTEGDRLSTETLNTVSEGGEVVEEMEGAMKEITTSSEEIAEIIAKVNDIAFQTNLLALNAAVEAARAGEQGRGFAVVAAEVRNLAGRTAESAAEIEKLIKSSIEKVERGNRLMVRTKEVLNAIVSNTQKTSDVVGEIAASIREQSTGAEDIRQVIEELNQTTQQNASLVEEIASSSENLNSESMELLDVVNQFKLEEGGARKKEKSKAPVKEKRDSGKAEREEEDFDFDEMDFDKF